MENLVDANLISCNEASYFPYFNHAYLKAI